MKADHFGLLQTDEPCTEVSEQSAMMAIWCSCQYHATSPPLGFLPGQPWAITSTRGHLPFSLSVSMWHPRPHPKARTPKLLEEWILTTDYLILNSSSIWSLHPPNRALTVCSQVCDPARTLFLWDWSHSSMTSLTPCWRKSGVLGFFSHGIFLPRLKFIAYHWQCQLET